jgi:tetratricopeptide (TPR) repeat protein
LLALYGKVYEGKGVGDDERSIVQSQLKLSGLVKAEDRYLHIRNEIYRRAFDLAWVRENTAVNWAPIVAGIAVFVALLAIGSILYNFWVGMQVDVCEGKLRKPGVVPEEKFDCLAKIFRSRDLFEATNYDYRANELFYGLSGEEQSALFNVTGVQEPDLVVVITGLYVTLADVDGTDSTGVDGTDRIGSLLKAMARALDRCGGTGEAIKLREEIDDWGEGRELVRQDPEAALRAYNRAIALNGENPATLYERARVLIELLEYEQALSDLDQVVAIAMEAETTPTPPPSTGTLTTTSTSTRDADVLPIQTLTSSIGVSPVRTPSSGEVISPIGTSPPGEVISPIEIPPPGVTAISTPSPVSTETPMPTPTSEPVSVVSEFATFGERISAVRNLIYSDPELVSFLVSASSSEYLYLRESGLVPTPTLVPTRMPTPIYTPTTMPTPTVGLVPTPTPSATGTIFFTRSDPSDDRDIYWIKPDGSTEGLFYGSDRSDVDARISPDGTQVIFTYGQEGDPDQSDIYRINLDGTGLQQLTNTPSRVEHSAWWSPDGTLIAYLGTYGGAGSGTVWTMNPDGSNQTQIVRGGEAHKASFGSDGRIYFQSIGLQTSTYDLYRVNSDGSSLEIVVETPNDSEMDLMLSPDGTRLVFSRTSGLGTNADICSLEDRCLPDIWLMDVDGGNEVQLTSNHGNNRAPVWSPDGTKIAFVSDVDGDHGIFIMNADGSGMHQVTHNTVGDWTSHWADVEIDAVVACSCKDTHEPDDLEYYLDWPPLEPGMPVDGYICYEHIHLEDGESVERDWYYFQIDSLYDIEVDLDVPDTVNYDLFLWVGDHWEPSENPERGADEHIEWSPWGIGTYVVVVKSAGDWDNCNPYTLEVTLKPQ